MYSTDFAQRGNIEHPHCFESMSAKIGFGRPLLHARAPLRAESRAATVTKRPGEKIVRQAALKL